MGSLPLNVDAVATSRGAVVGCPSVRIVGQSELYARAFGHCGNDFSATSKLPRSLLDAVRIQTERVSDWMASLGYRGLFGLDYVVDEGTGNPCAVDLNPRWQGSTSLQTQSVASLGIIPLAALEIAYRTRRLDARAVFALGDVDRPLQGSQVFLKVPPGGGAPEPGLTLAPTGATWCGVARACHWRSSNPASCS